MSRELKPGDVAMVVTHKGYEVVALRAANGYWATPTADIFDGTVSLVRPLVVIDAEDREQVERLMDILYSLDGPGPATVTDRWQLALREFANPTPPKPDEPTGLGAVVEDGEGRFWTLIPEAANECVWGEVGDLRFKRWDDIAAVRVLSVGVQES